MISSTQTNHPLINGQIAPEAQKRVEFACDRLREAGLRITQPRISILRTLIVRDVPMSIEQIHDELNSRSCDLVTVYRCLAAFEEIGLVRRSFLHNGTSLYKMGDRQDSAYHIIDKESRGIRELDAATNARLAAVIKTVEETLRAEGYENVSHVLEFYAKAPAAIAAERSAVQVKVPAAGL